MSGTPQQIGPYRLDAEIGRGGMGVVYRAHDTRLDRKVAIKALPDHLAEDPDRLARFEREARLLASLNHPNVAGIHGVEEHEGRRYLVLEYVEGDTLAQRLDRGALPIDDALAIAVQIAAGVEAAHEAGVVHRDLKPGNIIITPDGKAKVLDFGLARVEEQAGPSSALSMSPTLTSPAPHSTTTPGVILGTAPYMSPEQSKGRRVDKRSDIWSFGVVVYEILTGVSPFAGDSVAECVGAILHKDVDLDRLPPTTPASVRTVLRRCLARDPARRLRDIGDARIELEDQGEAGAAEHLDLRPRGGARWIPWVVAAIALAGMTTVLARSASAPERPLAASPHLAIPTVGTPRFSLTDISIDRPPAVSPDGRQVVYCTTNEQGANILWLQPLNRFDGRPLEGAEGASYAFWAPDSRRVGFVVDGLLKQIDTATGRVRTIVNANAFGVRGACWTPSGIILYAPTSNSGIWAVEADGGRPRQVTTVDASIVDGSHRWPHALPDGKRFLFTFWSNDKASRTEHGGVYVASIDGADEPRRLVRNASMPALSPTGHLLVIREQGLVALPFDASTLDISERGVTIADDVMYIADSGFAAYSVSAEGTLTMALNAGVAPITTLTWSNRNGDTVGTAVQPASMMPYVRLSPDGSQGATLHQGATGEAEVWIVDLLRGVRTRLTPSAPWTHGAPVWSSDGDQVLYASAQTGKWDLYTRNADGSGAEDLLVSSDGDTQAQDWRGDLLLISIVPTSAGAPRTEILNTLSRESEVLFVGASLTGACLSPGGALVAYTLREGGRDEVFVQSIESGARWQVSTTGGGFPHWSDDGREIVYESPQRRIMAVAVESNGAEVTLGSPTTLFALDDDIATWDAAGDHERFLLARIRGRSTEPLRVILNWPALLEGATP